MHFKNKKWIYLVILSLIWGSSFILIKKGLIGLTSLQLGALRIIISGIFIFIFGFHTLKNIKRQQWKWLIVSGFIGTFFPAFLFAFAETEIDSAVASILNSLTPLNTILIGFSIFKIASSTRQIVDYWFHWNCIVNIERCRS
jgi:drug/metabolite transporter (DMT)-like permease